jgi:hypothetical protein
VAEGAPRSFFTSLAGLITGLAALVSAGVAAYNIYKNEIEPRSAAAAPIALRSFEAQPLEVAPGEALVLRWRSEHADACSLEPGIGAVGVAGSRSVRPAEDTTYILRCHGPAGETERSVSVSVVAHADERVLEVEPEHVTERARARTSEPAEETVRVIRKSPLATLPEPADDALTDNWQQEALERLQRLAEALDDGGGEDSFAGAPDDGYEPPAVSSPPLAYHCCDLDGVQRCPLVSPVLIGSGCFCPFQGTGISCP